MYLYLYENVMTICSSLFKRSFPICKGTKKSGNKPLKG